MAFPLSRSGNALLKIHDGKLWQAGGFETWEDYCRSVAGMSRIHAHRLMKASQCVIEFRAMSDFSLLPESESQVRPLLSLADSSERRAAWDYVQNFIAPDGRPPTAQEVSKAVQMIKNSDNDGIPLPKAPTRAEQRFDLVSKLRTAVSGRKSWKQVEKLLAELEKLI
jgi:hypothetical protein